AGELREQAHRPPEHVVQIHRALEEHPDRPPLGPRERSDLLDRVDEVPVPLLRGDPAGARVRLDDEALRLEHRHVVADGRTRHPQGVPVDQRLRAHRLVGGDVVGDDRTQDIRPPIRCARHDLLLLTGYSWARDTSVSPARPAGSADGLSPSLGQFRCSAVRPGPAPRCQTRMSRTTPSASSRPLSVNAYPGPSGCPASRRYSSPASTCSSARASSSVVNTESASPSARRRPVMIRSMCRSVSVSCSPPSTGSSPASQAAAYRAGCWWFHQRAPPTWEWAPGPTPHQSPPRQYPRL